ncbi:Hypothetical predicted protein [Marmota monax]|uniref:Uncharacterized protein n=1 Tax=Marmota monax TaxID=9995 RepID=A0A5E4A3T5_MARMO|nr:Hypothetical predicted protein [Marmota monax]
MPDLKSTPLSPPSTFDLNSGLGALVAAPAGWAALCRRRCAVRVPGAARTLEDAPHGGGSEKHLWLSGCERAAV